jgi:tRNA (cytidine/uridine-2'-O-)-methyltransferase
LRLALFQPDIAPNLGAAIRLTACLGVGLDVIEPCGFPLSDKSLKRAALDYGPSCALTRHNSFAAFCLAVESSKSRLILIETDGATAFTDFSFDSNDILMLGRETLGTPDDARAACDATIMIPMQVGMRSLNVINAGAIVLTEALRQTGGWAGLRGANNELSLQTD